MDTGNDPGRDEYGLPPVDIEIPDDARDLDRDVQAYYRELRARRRHMRFRRLTGPLTRHGMVMPLVAACLAGTLLVGTLLTVLSGRQIPLLRERPFGTAPANAAAGPTPPGARPRSAAPRSAASQHTAPAAMIPHGQAAPLPDVPVAIGTTHVQLLTLVPAVLALIPARCHCAGIVTPLAGQAATAGVRFYLVGDAATVAELPALARQAGLGHHHVLVVSSNALGSAYDASGLTVILANRGGLVGAGGVVRFNVAGNLTAAQQFTAGLHALAQRQ